MELDALQKHMLETISDLHEIPEGAYNIRDNGVSAGRQVTANIDIVSKEDKPGIDIIVKKGTKNESVHIPVILSKAGMKDLVYNDFYIEEDADVLIVAGCGIHCGGSEDMQHDGIHTFHIGKNAKVKYVEKHYGEGEGTGGRILNPVTEIFVEEGGSFEMESVQIKGVDSTVRNTNAVLGDKATLIIREKIMTHGTQRAETNFKVELNGEDSSADLVSRSVAKGESYQIFNSGILGNNKCYGHSECDGILMEKGRVVAVPSLDAACIDASLIHEAAIGKIAGEQIDKLMTLGLTEEEAEAQIVNGFLK